MNEELQYVLGNLHHIGLAVDVGANHGDFSKQLVDVGLYVIAIEPNEKLFQELLEKLPAETIISVAASDLDGEAEFYVGSGSDGACTLEEFWMKETFPREFKTFEKQQVTTRRLSTIFKNLNIKKVSFLKIDAEGHDYKVLKGLTSENTILPNIIMFEANGRYPEMAVESLRFLQELGYKNYRIFIRCGEELLDTVDFDDIYLPPEWFKWNKEKDIYANIVCR